MIGYQIQRTLSDFGSVSRGICEADEQSCLKAVVERTEILRKNGKIVFRDESSDEVPIPGDTLVSMNIWGFTPVVFSYIEQQFSEFIRKNVSNIKAELYIPKIVNELIKNGKANVKILPATDKWFGVTYREDKPTAVQNIHELIKQGVYPDNLWKK
jgi:hypothetical protein